MTETVTERVLKAAGGAGGATVPGGGQTDGAPMGRAVKLPRVAGFASRPERDDPRRAGKALRERVPRGAHAGLVIDPDRPDPVTAVEESNQGRLPALTPIRVGRMAAGPFAFLRGAAPAHGPPDATGQAPSRPR